MTLVELVIIVAVITTLMTFAIQSLINSRISSNEGSAVTSLRTITSANQQYEIRFQSFASRLNDFSDNGYFDSVLGYADVSPGKSGYLFQYTGSGTSWVAEAHPINGGFTGRRYFYVDTSGIIFFAEGRRATAADTPVD